MQPLLSAAHPPTAIVAASDNLALGAIRAARSRGIRVPDDVAIVSFDDPVYADLFDPPITALANTDLHIGELAATLLLHAMQTGATDLPLRFGYRPNSSCGAPAVVQRLAACRPIMRRSIRPSRADCLRVPPALSIW